MLIHFAQIDSACFLSGSTGDMLTLGGYKVVVYAGGSRTQSK